MAGRLPGPKTARRARDLCFHLGVKSESRGQLDLDADIGRRIARYDWPAIESQLDDAGHARLPALLRPAECQQMRALFEHPDAHANSHDDNHDNNIDNNIDNNVDNNVDGPVKQPGRNAIFRKTIVMEQHGYGRGQYRYFAYPLPGLVGALRTALYPPLAVIGNRWNERLDIHERYPGALAPFLTQCRAAEQVRPTPLLLRYRAGDYNRMHQDLYGKLAFPLQITCVLSPPDDAHTPGFQGGEFLISESRPRMQSRTTAIRLALGEGIIFANALRPVASARGHARAAMRHGLSTVLAGERVALGVIFHDAK